MNPQSINNNKASGEAPLSMQWRGAGGEGMNINPTRLQQHFEAMSLIGKIGETGTCRPAHTALEKQGFEIAAAWMKEAGMQTHIDNFGNLIGRLEGKNKSLPVLMMGS
ncbi:MAG: hypothetical protein ABJB86_15345, partial [Bacteroidota bacterium]